MSEVAQRSAIVVDILTVITRAGFDMFVYGNTFYSVPDESDSFNHVLAFHDFFFGPYFTIGNVMEGGYNAGSTSLFNVRQADRIVGAIPAE